MIIHAVNVNELITVERVQRLMNLVSPQKQAKLQKMHFEKDRIRGAVGEVLIKELIKKHYDLSRSEINFLYNPYGKPYIEHSEAVHLNISHSGDWVLAVVDKNEIGIDVEKKDVYEWDIANRFFSYEENQYLKTLQPMAFDEGFIRLWTLKESYIKAVGKGLSIPLDSFSKEIFTRYI